MDNHNNKEIRTAYIYRRVSSDEQARGGISLDIQQYDIVKYAAENNIKIIGDYEDAGVSAGKPVRKRPALSQMLDDMEREKPDILLLWRLDRLWRRVSDYYDVQKVLEKIDCEFFCVDEPFYDTRSATGRLYINIKLSIAENERDQTGERLTAMFRSRAMRGIVNGGTKTLGYDIKEDERGDRRYVINEAEAEMVRGAFEHYINCGSISATSQWLRDTYGYARTPKSLRWFLFGNSMYIGKKEVRPQGANYLDEDAILFTIDDYCPPIIDQRTWDIAQSMLNTKGRNPQNKKNDYAFSSLLRCACCGRPMTPYPTTRKRKDGTKYLYKSYRCQVARHPQQVSDGTVCTMRKTITEGPLERAVLEEIKRQLGDHIVAVEQDVKSRKKTNKDIQAQITKTKGKLMRVNELYIEDMLSKEEYERRTEGLKEEIAQLEASMVTATEEQVQQMKDTMDTVNSFGEIYDTLSSAEKNVLFRNIIKYIELSTDPLEMKIHFL